MLIPKKISVSEIARCYWANNENMFLARIFWKNKDIGTSSFLLISFNMIVM